MLKLQIAAYNIVLTKSQEHSYVCYWD